MNSSSRDPLCGTIHPITSTPPPCPTEGEADLPPLDSTDLPAPEEIVAAFPELEIFGLIEPLLTPGPPVGGEGAG